MGHAVLGFVLTFKLQHDASMAAIERGFTLNPNYVDWRFGWPLVVAGHSRRAIDVLEAGMRLDPFHPALASFQVGTAHFMLKEYSRALAFLRAYTSHVPQMVYGHLWLVVTYAQLGRIKEAREEIAEMLRLRPDVKVSGTIRTLIAFKNLKDEKHFFDALCKAGLPE